MHQMSCYTTHCILQLNLCHIHLTGLLCLTCTSAANAKCAMMMHLEVAAGERRHFYDNNALAERGTDYCSMIIDGMTQHTTALPHFDRTVKGLDKDNVDVHCVGSIIAGVGNFMEFSYANLPNNANLLIDTLHRNILRVHQHRRLKGLGMPSVLCVELDNCNTNKSKALMAYCVHLVKMRVFTRIEISFMLVGHTHENIDQIFSTYSVKLRTVKAFTLESLMQVAKDAFHVKKPEVSHITAVNDWDKFFKKSGNYKDFKHTMNQHVFEIKRDDDTSDTVFLRAKLYSTRSLFLPEQGLDILPGALLPGAPELQTLQSFTPLQRESMIACRNNLSSLLGEEFDTDITLKRYWDDLEAYQDSIPATALGVVPSRLTVPFEWPCNLVIVPVAAPITVEQIADTLPEALFNVIFPLETALCLTNAADAHDNRVQSVLTNDDGVQFEQMNVGSVALCLVGDDFIGSKLAFRLKMRDVGATGGGEEELGCPALEEIPCPLMTLNQVVSIDRATRVIRWSYLAPSRYVAGRAKQQLVGKQMAKEPGFFHSRNDSQLEYPFASDEIIIAWDYGAGEDSGCIPYIQHQDAVIMIEAMHRARVQEARIE